MSREDIHIQGVAMIHAKVLQFCVTLTSNMFRLLHKCKMYAALRLWLNLRWQMICMSRMSVILYNLILDKFPFHTHQTFSIDSLQEFFLAQHHIVESLLVKRMKNLLLHNHKLKAFILIYNISFCKICISYQSIYTYIHFIIFSLILISDNIHR